MYIVLANLMCLCVRGCGYVFVGVHVHAYESDLMIVISMHGRLEFWGMHFKTVCVGREEEGGGGLRADTANHTQPLRARI